MQDAVPMTLGQEFLAFAHTLREDVDRLAEAQSLIREINLGATAIGTGINAPLGYAEMAAEKLAVISGVPVLTAPDLVEATSDTGAFVQLSGRDETHCDQTVENLQRSPLAVVGAARRIWRNQFAGHATGIVDHARAK